MDVWHKTGEQLPELHQHNCIDDWKESDRVLGYCLYLDHFWVGVVCLEEDEDGGKQWRSCCSEGWILKNEEVAQWKTITPPADN